MRLAGVVVMSSLLASVATPAWAFTTGISGSSGKDGKDCTACHSGSSASPRATLVGPAALGLGESATYQLVIDTDVTSSASAKRAVGIDIATTAGTLKTVVQKNSTRVLAGEISHTDALPKAKEVAVSFLLTAPMADGPLTLFAAALSADGNGGKSGDATAVTQLEVAVGTFDLGGAAMPDLDAMSGATQFVPTTPPDAGPPKDEPRWGCDMRGVPEVAGTSVLLLGVFVAFRARRTRSRALP